MSRLISITVPVEYSYGEKVFKLSAVADNYLIGRDRDGALSSFEWNSGQPVPFQASEKDMEEAGHSKVRRNFWARMLTRFWKGEADAASVINAFAADELLDAFRDPSEGLHLNNDIQSLAELLTRIIED